VLLAGGTLLGLWGAYFTRVYDAPVQALSEGQRTGPFWTWLYLHLLLTLCLILSSVGLTLAVSSSPALTLTSWPSWLVGGGVGGSFVITGLLGLVNQWGSVQPQPGTRGPVAVRVAAGASLLLTAPWASPLLLLLLATVTGLGILLMDYFGPLAPASSFQGIASRYTPAAERK
jgi:low temperature requirement protein LtrA